MVEVDLSLCNDKFKTLEISVRIETIAMNVISFRSSTSTN